MNASPGWRRTAVKLSQHAAAVLPAASPWAQAMRREIDYIEDDRAALGWALGCVLASYKARVAARTAAGLGRLQRFSRERNPIPLSGARRREILRHAAASAALMFVTGVALLENAGGQTAPRLPPPPAAVEETACDTPDKAAGMDRPPSGTLRAAPDAGRTDPTLDTPCAGRRHAPIRILPRFGMP